MVEKYQGKLQMDNDHNSHKWIYSDSSYYDLICEKCGVAEGSTKASEPCPNFFRKLGETWITWIEWFKKDVI